MKLSEAQNDALALALPEKAAADARQLPRVLYALNLNPSEKFGSLEEQIVTLHQAFTAEAGRFLPLFTCPPRPGMTDAFRARGVEAHCLNLCEFRWRTLIALRALIRREKIDLLHWHFTEPVFNPYLWWLSMLNPRVRHFFTDHVSRPIEPHTPPGGWKKMAKRMLLNCYEKTLCVSAFVQGCLAAQGTWRNVDVCRHFINTDRFVPDPGVRAQMRRQFDVADRFVVIVVAQLIREKGIDVVLRALTQLPDRAVLWIVGGGDQAEPLQALTHTLGLDRRVQFFGLQRHVERFMQAADCFVLASRWQEAAGLVLLEAQSAGLPVVASRIGGIPEYVKDGRTGFLFTPNDDAELARHLRALCNDADLYRRMGRQARALAVESFSVNSQLADWLDRYRRDDAPLRLAPRQAA
jgi:glycosyltransferase involved in cell wall biosynthesis